MTVDIPNDEAESVAEALREQASWYRRDTNHPPDGIVELNKTADVFDAIADDIEARLARIEADKRSAAMRVTP